MGIIRDCLRRILSLLLAVAMALGTLPVEAVAEQLSAIDLGTMTDVISLGDADESGVEKDLGAEPTTGDADESGVEKDLGAEPTTGDAAELGEDEKEEEVLIGAQSASLEVYNSEPAGSGTVDIQWRWNSDTWESRTDHVPSGAEVRITANPADGYVLSHFRVRRLAPGADVPVDVQGNVGTFTVPDTAQVTIMAYFEQGVAPVTKYPVGVNVVCADVLEDQCSVTVEPEEAEAGETVTVTVHKSSMVEFRPYGVDDQTPLFYVMSGQNAMNRWFDYFFDDQNNEGSPVTQATQVDDTTFTFTMPAEEVVVSANFRSVPFTLTLGEDVPDNVLSIYDAPNNATLLARNIEGLRAIEVRAGDRLRVDAMFADMPGDLKRMWYSYEQDGQTKEVELPHAVGYLNSSDSFTMPLANVTLHTEVKMDIWPVKVSVSHLYGTVSCDVEKAMKGEKITFTAVPYDSSRYTDFYVNDIDGACLGINRVSEGVYEFEMPSTRVSIQVTFPTSTPRSYYYLEATVNDGKVTRTPHMNIGYGESLSPPSTHMTGGLYILAKDMVFDETIYVSGDTRLILCDGYTLTANKSISIDTGSSLTIYGQKYDSGKIVAYSDPDREDAAIGGRDCITSGSLAVHGGQIYAKARNKYGAGIGGGDDIYSGAGNIVIYGGRVEAEGAVYGAGIGMGDDNEGFGAVTIYGGIVTAEGGNEAAGIGGGRKSNGLLTRIYGGTVTAIGGNGEDPGAGIGSGANAEDGGKCYIYGGTVMAKGGHYNSNSESASGGAGIGSGASLKGAPTTCVIYDGTVTATGGYAAAGIGGGASGYYGDGMHGEIQIHGGDVTATGGDYAAGIGTGLLANNEKIEGNKRALIEITGGIVHAYGGGAAAGIGGGSTTSDITPPSKKEGENILVNLGTIRIAGGEVYAQGGYTTIEDDERPGTEDDDEDDTQTYNCYGPGIGAGRLGHVNKEVDNHFICNIAITDGHVTATNDGPNTYGYAAIGNLTVDGFARDSAPVVDASGNTGSNNRISLYLGERVCARPKPNSECVSAEERNNTAQSVSVGGVVIETCKHTEKTKSYETTSVSHRRKCGLCLDDLAFQWEGHILDEDDKCAICGYDFDNDAVYTVTFNKDASDATGNMDAVTHAVGDDFTVPECGFARSGYRFSGWLTGDGTVLQSGDVLSPASNLKLTVQWERACLVTFLSGDASAQGRMAQKWLSGGETLDISQIACGFFVPGKNFDQWLAKVDDKLPVTLVQYKMEHGGKAVVNGSKSDRVVLEARYRSGTYFINDLGARENAYCYSLSSNTEVLEGGCWYVVEGDTEVPGRLSLAPKNGYLDGREVNIVLADGATLQTKGIEVDSGWTLNIWRQSEGTGRLVVDGVEQRKAGIGGGGAVRIYGGTVEAMGGYLAAGIGGDFSGSAGSVSVYGGRVFATGGAGAAGIGCGAGGAGGLVEITGGEVEATNVDGTLGIGGSNGAHAASVLLGAQGPSATSIRSSGYEGNVALLAGFRDENGVIGRGSHNNPMSVNAASLSGSVLESCAVAQVALIPGEGLGKESVEQAEAGSSFAMPACTFKAPEGKTFRAWNVSVNGAKAIEVLEGGTVALEGDAVATAIWDPEPRAFGSVRLSLGGSIGVEFGVDTPEEGIGDLSVVFEVCGRKLEVSASEALSDGDRLFFRCPVSAVEMADEVKATLMAGGMPVGFATCSVERYAAHVAAHEEEFGAAAVALARALADYGYYAQPFLARVNGWQIGREHAAMSLHFAQGYDSAGMLAKAEVFAPRIVPAESLTGATYKLRLDSGTSLEVVLRHAGGLSMEDIKTDFLGKDGLVDELPGGGVSARVEGVPAHRLGDRLTVSLGGGSVSVCALSYVRDVLRGDYTNDAKDAACALLRYHEVARSYIESLEV